MRVPAILILVAWLFAGPVSAAETALVDCKLSSGDPVKTTIANCQQLGGRIVEGSADLSATLPAASADVLYKTWEDKHRSDHEQAYKAALDFVKGYADDPRASEVQRWMSAYEKVVGAETVQRLTTSFTPVITRDCEDCPEMAWLPRGTFQMGSPVYERGRHDNEGPVHEVHINYDLAISTTPVTVGQYRAFEKDSGYRTGKYCRWDGQDHDDDLDWSNPGFPQDDNHPVVCISWKDANAYAHWLTQKTGKPYRLPSEAEWEYAARAGTSSATYWGGNNDAEACDHANLGDQSLGDVPSVRKGGYRAFYSQCNDRFSFTSPVRSFHQNPWGLYDMFGNVWQWVQDCRQDDYMDAPTDGSARASCIGSAWDGEHHPSNKMLRGGSFVDMPSTLRAAARRPDKPERHGVSEGFRIALTR